MDRALDEIVAERQRGGGRGSRGSGRGRGYGGRDGGRRYERTEYPRDGVRKSTRDDSRNIDSEWVHDKFDDNSAQRSIRNDRRYSPEPVYDADSAKLRVENLHYDLTEDDLDDLFQRIGPVLKLSLSYDRAGRSNGVAYVTYESSYDAKRAIREFDGANAKGQPIRLIPIPNGPAASRRGPPPSRGSLFDRITPRHRSESPIRHSDVSGPAPKDVDRYVPSGRRSRSPRPHRGSDRRDGRRPGARHESGAREGKGGRGGRGGERLARDGRPRKTQEELDAEMDDYFGGGGSKAETETATETNGNTEVAQAGGDVDMDDIS